MITRIIHQIGPDDQNQWPYIWVEGHNLIKKTFPNFKHFLWKNSDIYPFIERNYPQYYKLIDELPTITKCDFFRNILMHYYGGIYFDLDFLVYKNFYEKLDSKKPTIIEGMYKASRGEHVQNNFLASPIEHPVWIKVMDEVERNFKTLDRNDTWYNKVMKISSSLFFTNYIKKYPDDFSILPRDPYNLTKDECKKYKEEEIPCRHIGTDFWNHDSWDTT
tara:strand:- start:119 stop:775 length:657 start_codon:yes stop_codon:yes gene_type:complete